MSGDANMRRSQAILRMPVDNVVATLLLHDGERSDVVLFIPPNEDITALISPGAPFVPMIRDARFCLVARDAIAALGVVTGAERPDDGSLPIERQRTRVRLRSGKTLEGEVRWISTDGAARTADHFNEPVAFFVLHSAEQQTTYYVAKGQVATVEELG